MVEPLNLHLDVKRYITNTKAPNKSLLCDIDGAMDPIQITLGQRDLSVILAVYVDNIGEAKFVDFIQNGVGANQVSNEIDETVSTLEAFFCEPKQKNISFKLSLDGIKVFLFFDSGELLSSPIRDLNHGLCKFETVDINTSMVIFTDKSIDGKLCVDNIFIEEMGPDANLFDKR